MQKVKENNSETRSGLVVSYFGNSVAVEAEDGQVFQCHLRRNQELPVVGDTVRWQLETGNTGIIIAIQPRRSLLSRGDGRGRSKPIAANLDTVVIVMAPPPIFSEYLIDRYLIAAELLGIQPVIVLNKTDLLTDMTRPDAEGRLASYRQISYPVVQSSIYLPAGLQEVAGHLQGKTSVLIGPSGVGKSSIIAKLTEGESIRIGDVSSKGAGKHTTTATRLYHLPKGGHLIDSPGVREFNLWRISPQEVLRGFRDFQVFIGGCKFRDCRHVVEPGCAVRAAVEHGKISAERYASYQELMKEAEEHENSRYSH
ncbi:MAG: small ribosomal subunit biogenesis GTPase RsgA [Gammaproteobacteria bacterium]|nr:MAG: small ribosomal subunit biogenesis GTPase RsgA [Gammaproteobacteria bacterium]